MLDPLHTIMLVLPSELRTPWPGNKRRRKQLQGHRLCGAFAAEQASAVVWAAVSLTPLQGWPSALPFALRAAPGGATVALS